MLLIKKTYEATARSNPHTNQDKRSCPHNDRFHKPIRINDPAHITIDSTYQSVNLIDRSTLVYTYTGPRVPRRTGAHGLPRSRFPRPPCPAPGFELPFSDAQGSILQLSVTIFMILMCLCRSRWHRYWISLRAECIFEYPKAKYMTLGPKFFFCNKMITAPRRKHLNP